MGIVYYIRGADTKVVQYSLYYHILVLINSIVKNLIVIILFWLTCLSSFGQLRVHKIPTDGSNTAGWYRQQKGLPDLRRSSDSLHFRFSISTQDIDIWTNDYKTFYGTFANSTTGGACNNCLIKEKDKYYSLKSDLDPETARYVYELFSQLSIFDIPTMDSIKGWHHGCDGEGILIEHSTAGHYCSKVYWSPDGFKETIKEAAVIDTLVHQLRTKLDMYASQHAFLELLPPGCYSCGGFAIWCHNMWPDFIMW